MGEHNVRICFRVEEAGLLHLFENTVKFDDSHELFERESLFFFNLFDETESDFVVVYHCCGLLSVKLCVYYNIFYKNVKHICTNKQQTTCAQCTIMCAEKLSVCYTKSF